MKYPPNVQAPRRTGAFSLIPLSLFAAVTVLSFWIATQWAASQLGFQPRLGAGVARRRTRQTLRAVGDFRMDVLVFELCAGHLSHGVFHHRGGADRRASSSSWATPCGWRARPASRPRTGPRGGRVRRNAGRQAS